MTKLSYVSYINQENPFIDTKIFSFFQSCLKYCQNGEEVEEILAKTSLSDKIIQDLAKRSLFRLSAFDNWSMYSNFASFVSLRFDEEIVKNLLRQAMSLWSDPVIGDNFSPTDQKIFLILMQG